MTAGELSEKIKNSRRKSPAKAFLEVCEKIEFPECDVIFGGGVEIVFGDYDIIKQICDENESKINAAHIELSARKSVLDMADISCFDARIEPFAHIRGDVKIGHGAVIMHGAVINSGAIIGAETMIDMNAVVGSCAEIGDRCHIGAGAVIAGVLEPSSPLPVKIGAGVLIGANATLLEGVSVGDDAVVGAGAVVTHDVPPNCTAVGVPAHIVGFTENIKKNIRIVEDLR